MEPSLAVVDLTASLAECANHATRWGWESTIRLRLNANPIDVTLPGSVDQQSVLSNAVSVNADAVKPLRSGEHPQ